MKLSLILKPLIKVSSCAWLLLVISCKLHAQLPINDPNPWTLAQCIDYAKQNNLQVASTRLAEQLAEQGLLLSKAAKYPNLIAATTQTLTHRNLNGFSVGTTDGTFGDTYSLNSAMTLYNGNYLNNDIRQKDLLAQATSQDILATENNITLQITQAFLQILLAKENVTYFDNLVQTAQAQNQQAELKYKAGSLARAVWVELQAQLANDQYNLVNAINAQRQATFNLKLLLQLPATTDFRIVTPDTLHVINDFTPLAYAESIALSHRPEIKSSELTRQAAAFQLLEARAGRQPLITLNSTLASDYSNNQHKGYGQQINNNIYERIGLTLTFPIFNNRVVKTDIAKSQIAIGQADVNLRNTQTVLSQQVEQSYINSINAESQLEAADKQLTANQETYRISLEQLRLGAITATDFLVQKSLYIQAMQSYLQAKYNALIAVQVYRFYQGEPIEL